MWFDMVSKHQLVDLFATEEVSRVTIFYIQLVLILCKIRYYPGLHYLLLTLFVQNEFDIGCHVFYI